MRIQFCKDEKEIPIFAGSKAQYMLRKIVSIKWKAALVIVLMIFTACSRNGKTSAPEVTISGVLKGAENKLIRLSELDVLAIKPIDSVNTGKNGEFSFKMKPGESSLYLLTLLPQQKLILVADPGDDIRIEGVISNILRTVIIKGSKASDWLLGFERFTSQNQVKADSLSQLFMNSRSDPEFAGIRLHLDSVYKEILDSQRLYMEKFIDEHPASLASLIVLNYKFGPNRIFSEENDVKYFSKVDSGLMAGYPGNKHTLENHSRVAAMKKKQSQRLKSDSLLLPGNLAPDVRLNNAEGIPYSVSSLKGKVVLIYFWAAMNGESRKFIRNLIPVYKANRNRGFEIYGVAIEPNKTLWLNAIKLDQPGGIQVFADGGTESPAAAMFGIAGLPEAMLIDRQGRISERRISLDDLRKKLPVLLRSK